MDKILIILVVLSILPGQSFGYGGHFVRHGNAIKYYDSHEKDLKNLEETPYYLYDGTPYRDALTIQASKAVSFHFNFIKDLI